MMSSFCKSPIHLKLNCPKLPCLTVEDAENGGILHFRPRSGKEFKSRSQALRERNTKLCREAGVDLVPIINGEDYVTPLLGLFKRRSGKR